MFGPPGPNAPRILGIITQRYTGATARKIDLAIDTYPCLKPDWNSGVKNCNSGASDHRYRYQMTFTLGGIVTEIATTGTGGCEWERSILGLSEKRPSPMAAIRSLPSNGSRTERFPPKRWRLSALQ